MSDSKEKIDSLHVQFGSWGIDRTMAESLVALAEQKKQDGQRVTQGDVAQCLRGQRFGAVNTDAVDRLCIMLSQELVYTPSPSKPRMGDTPPTARAA